jgi:hypothetical protein
VAIADVLVDCLDKLGLEYPGVDDAQRLVLEAARHALENE